MSCRVIVKNGSIYFNTKSFDEVTFAGQTFKSQQWYDNITIDYTYNESTTIYVPAFGLESGGKVENGMGNYGTNIDNYPAGYASHYNASGSPDYAVFARGTLAGRLYMAGASSSGTYYFHGDGSDTPVSEYTTTLDCSNIKIDGEVLSASNCSVYYGDTVGSKSATISGNTVSFTTPSGGGSCNVWFCKLDSTTTHTIDGVISDSDGGVYNQNSDGSFTFELNGDSDTSLTLSGVFVTSLKIELIFSNMTIDADYVTSSSDLVIGYHFDTGNETKVKYKGNAIAVSFPKNTYTTFYMTFYNEAGQTYDSSQLDFTTKTLTVWNCSTNVCWCELNTDGDSDGTVYGDLPAITGDKYTLNIANMVSTDGENFTTKYSGAVLTYSPASGYEFDKGSSFDVKCTISGGWKFDTGSSAYSNVHASGDEGITTAVIFTDEHNFSFNIPADIANPIAYVYDMLAVKEESPQPDYATFITPYLVSKADVNAIANAIWIGEDGSEITATNNILSYKQIYDTLSSDNEQTLKLGGYSVGRTAKYLVDYTFVRTLGGVTIPEYWHNADDYENTEISIYVPLVGLVSVDAKVVMGHTLRLDYRYEIIDGKALAVLYCDSYGSESIIWQSSCNFAITEPISSESYMSYANSYWNILTSQLGELQPYVLIDRKQPAVDVIDVSGNRVQIVKKVSDCNGFVAFERVYLNDIDGTSNELEEINSLLTSGIIV